MTYSGDVIVSVAATVALFLIVYGPWQWVWTDIGRQVVFESRDAIFLLAADGKMKFSSTEYKVIRHYLQSNIRFAHKATAPLLFWMAILGGSALKRSSDEMDSQAAIELIADLDTRRQVQQHLKRANYAMVGMVICKSPLLAFCVGCVLAAAFVISGISKAHSILMSGGKVTLDLIRIGSHYCAS